MQTEDLIASINAEDDRRYVESYRFMEEQKIKKALAPVKWKELKDTLANECARIQASSPTQIAMEDEGNDATLTNLRKGGSVSLRYISDVPCIQVTAGGKSATIGFRPSLDGNSVEFMEGTIPRDIVTIAVGLIRRIR